MRDMNNKVIEVGDILTSINGGDVKVIRIDTSTIVAHDLELDQYVTLTITDLNHNYFK